MRELQPQAPDPRRVFPEAGAEPIIGVTFGLELPFSLRLPEVKFVVSRSGSGWEGWGADEVGHLIDLDAKVPEGLEPHFRIALNQSKVTVPAPFSAAAAAYPDWPGFDQRREDAAIEVERTTALVSVYSRLMDS